MVNPENHISFGYVKVPGDDRGGFSDLDQNLQEGLEITEIWEGRQLVVCYVSLPLQDCNLDFIQLVAPHPTVNLYY